jgi:hypothetical protein
MSENMGDQKAVHLLKCPSLYTYAGFDGKNLPLRV